MLLRHTPKEISERKALTINPAKTCQPIGAMYAALGIHGCLPHSHGSQGCCAYHRSTLTRHYKEPVMAATSSFTEGASVFGGQANLVQAIDNIFTIYEPDVIAVHTTCLSETIGDDIPQIARKAEADGKIPSGKYVIHVNTPSYVGTHVTGFANMTKAMVDYFAESTGKKSDRINIIPGYVEPSDMEEIKRMADDDGRAHRAVSGYVQRAQPATDRQVRDVSQGRRDGGSPQEHRRQHGDHRPGAAGFGTGGTGPGHQVQGATAKSSICPSGSRPPTASWTPCGKPPGSTCPTRSTWNAASCWISSPTCTSTSTARKWRWRAIPTS